VGVTGCESSRGLMWVVEGGSGQFTSRGKNAGSLQTAEWMAPRPSLDAPKWMKTLLAMFRTVIPREITDMSNNSLGDVRYTCVYLFITKKCKQLEIIEEVCRITSPFFKSQISKRWSSKKKLKMVWVWLGVYVLKPPGPIFL